MAENVPQRLDGSEGLTTAEGRDLAKHERKILSAMHAAGKSAGDALRDIRDRRLYRAGHDTFESYCLDRWGFSRSTGYRMIDVAKEKAARAELTNPLSHENGESAGPGVFRETKGKAAVEGSAEPITTTATANDSGEAAGALPRRRSTSPVTPPAPERPATAPSTPSEPAPAPTAGLGVRHEIAGLLNALRAVDVSTVGPAMTIAEAGEVATFAAEVVKSRGATDPLPPTRLTPPTVVNSAPRPFTAPKPGPTRRHALGCTCFACAGGCSCFACAGDKPTAKAKG